MYYYSFNTVLPFAADLNGYDRFLRALVWAIVLPLLLLVGFLAIESDFVKTEATNFSNTGNRPTNTGDAWGRGIIFCPMMTDELFTNFSADTDYTKSNGVIFDSTIYTSPDLVDNPPELVWMVYPNLSNLKTKDASAIRVLMNVLVDCSGKTLEVIFTDGKEIDFNTKQLILEAVKTSIFKPARKNNLVVRCWVQIPLEVEA